MRANVQEKAGKIITNKNPVSVNFFPFALNN